MSKSTPEKQKRTLKRIADVADDGDIALLKIISELEDSVYEEIEKIKSGVGIAANLDEVLKDFVKSVKTVSEKAKEYTDKRYEDATVALNQTIKIFEIAVKDIHEKHKDAIDTLHRDNETRSSAFHEAISKMPDHKYIDDLVEKLGEGMSVNEKVLLGRLAQLEKEIKLYKTWPVGGGSSGIKAVVAGAGITVDNSNLGYPVITATTAGFSTATETLTGTQSGLNVTLDLTGLSHTFTSVMFVTRNGQVINSTAWSRSTNTITVFNADASEAFQVCYNY